MKIHENLWKSIENDESPQMTRSQPGIEQRFLKGQQVVHYRCKHSCSEIHENPWKSIKIHENPWKSMIINGKRWKSSDDKKPAWNRAKVSIGAAGCSLPLYTVVNIHARKSMKIHENPWKSMKICENLWKSMIIHRKRWKSSDDNTHARKSM